MNEEKNGKYEKNGNIYIFKHGIFHAEKEPAISTRQGHKEWWFEGHYHRVGGPAIEYIDGTKEWWLHGKRHRIDGPAIEYPDGSKSWYLQGNKYTELEFKEKLDNLYFHVKPADYPEIPISTRIKIK